MSKNNKHIMIGLLILIVTMISMGIISNKTKTSYALDEELYPLTIKVSEQGMESYTGDLSGIKFKINDYQSPAFETGETGADGTVTIMIPKGDPYSPYYIYVVSAPEKFKFSSEYTEGNPTVGVLFNESINNFSFSCPQWSQPPIPCDSNVAEPELFFNLDYGRLLITKEFEGEISDEEEFEIEISLGDDSLSGTHDYVLVYGSNCDRSFQLVKGKTIAQLNKKCNTASVNAPKGTSYEVKEINNSGYLVRYENETGILNDETTNVTITNKKQDQKVTITVKHVDKDGNDLKEAVTEEKDKGSSYSYNADSELLKEYTVDKQTQSGIANEDTTVTFVYTKKEVTPEQESEKNIKITVKHVDEKGNNLKDPITDTVKTGTFYEYKANEELLKTYTVTIPDNAKGKTGESDIEVTFVYKKKENKVVPNKEVKKEATKESGPKTGIKSMFSNYVLITGIVVTIIGLYTYLKVITKEE